MKFISAHFDQLMLLPLDITEKIPEMWCICTWPECSSLVFGQLLISERITSVKSSSLAFPYIH